MEIVSMVEPGGVTDVGENVPVAAAGKPEIANVTALAKPPELAMEIVNVAVCPAVMVADPGVTEGVKSIPVPVSVTVCVVGLALSVMVRAAGPRAPIAPGMKVTVMTQVPPEPATFAPFVQVVPVATVKSLAFVPVIVTVLAAANARAAPPLFVRVMVCAALAVPTPWLANVSVFGDSATVCGVAPVSAIVCVAGLASSVTVAVALRFPFAAGANVKLIRQVPFGASAVPLMHVVPCVTVKSPVFAPPRETFAVRCSVSVPLFVSVTVCAALVEPTGVAGKLTLVGLSDVAGKTPVPLSVSVCGLLAASSATLKVAVPLPEAPGVNVSITTHVAPALTAAPFVHVVPAAATANSGAFAPAIVTAFVAARCRAAAPAFVTVTVRGALVVPFL